MKNLTFFLVVGSLLFLCTSWFGQDTDVEMIRKMPSFFSAYHCSDYVAVVNHLRRLGKEQALKVLKTDAHENAYDDVKVLLICRLLFQNPEGWEPVAMGVPVPYVGSNAMAKFPLFPLALSERVPFLLLRGYQLDGRGESPAKCVELCRSFPMIRDDLADQNYEAAARSLIKSKEFKWLYSDHNEWFSMSKLILKQARYGNQ